MPPLVSIIIPCYNAERYVAEAIQSALDQTHPHCEIIVIDDGSTDGSLEVIKSFGDKIRWETGPNRGGCVARNRGLELANGEWIQFLDADDYLELDKIAIQISVLENAEQPGGMEVLYSPVRIERQRGNSCVSVEKPMIPVSDDPWVLHARWVLAQTGGALFLKTALEDAGAWNEHQVCCQDNELLFRLLVAGKRFLYCPGAVAVYREFDMGTVSTSQADRVNDEILRLLHLTEEHLRAHHQLNSERLNAINQHRFRLARKIWPMDKRQAGVTNRQIRASQPGFRPEPARHAPFSYRACHRLFGFAVAEHLAAWKRKFAKGT